MVWFYRVVQTWVMPTTDEELLIDAAISRRKSRKRGGDPLATFPVAAVFAAVGWFLVFWLRALIKSIPFLPLGTVTTTPAHHRRRRVRDRRAADNGCLVLR
jgi:hypothetical protein